MTFRGDTAVLVWRPGPAPGCGRTPRRCCTRSPAAACCRTRCTRSPRSRRSTWSWSWATTTSASRPPSPNWPTTLGRSDRRRAAGPAAGHRPRRALRPVRAARGLRRHRRRHLGRHPLLDADTLADLIATHSAGSAAATVLTTTLPRSHGLRPHPAHPGRRGDRRSSNKPTPRPSQREIREVNAGVYAFDVAALRSALSRLSSNNAQQELYLTDVIAILRGDGRPCTPGTSTTARWWPASTTASSWPSWAPSSTAASSPPTSWPA